MKLHYGTLLLLITSPILCMEDSFPPLIGEKVMTEIPECTQLETFLINKLCRKRIYTDTHITHAALSPNNDILALSEDGDLLLRTVTTSQPVHTLAKNDNEVTMSILFSPTGSHVALTTKHLPVCRDSRDTCRIRIWDVNSQEEVLSLNDGYTIVFCFCEDHETIVIQRDQVELWNIKENRLLYIFDANLGEQAVSIALAQNKLLALSGAKHSVWDIETQNRLKKDSYTGGTTALWFPQGHRYIIFNEKKQSAEKYYLYPDELLGKKAGVSMNKNYSHFKLAPSGKRSIYVSDRAVHLYYLPSEEEFIIQRYTRKPLSIEFSSDSQKVLVIVNTKAPEEDTNQEQTSIKNYSCIDLFDIPSITYMKQLLYHASFKQIKLYNAFGRAIKDKARIHADEAQKKLFESLPSSIQGALKFYMHE